MAKSEQEIKFKRGKSSSLPNEKEAGSFIVETDTGNAYIDDTDLSRIQLKDSTKLSLSGGTMTGDVDMQSNNITTSHTPTNGNDVVNKDYVDSRSTTYTGESPITVDGSVIKHDSTSAQSGGPASDQILEYEGTFKVPKITSDQYGHVTSIGEATMTMPKSAGQEAMEMLLDGIVSAFLVDENGNVILSDTNIGIMLTWPICNCEPMTKEFIDSLFV